MLVDRDRHCKQVDALFDEIETKEVTQVDALFDEILTNEVMSKVSLCWRDQAKQVWIHWIVMSIAAT